MLCTCSLQDGEHQLNFLKDDINAHVERSRHDYEQSLHADIDRAVLDLEKARQRKKDAFETTRASNAKAIRDYRVFLAPRSKVRELEAEVNKAKWQLRKYMSAKNGVEDNSDDDDEKLKVEIEEEWLSMRIDPKYSAGKVREYTDELGSWDDKRLHYGTKALLQILQEEIGELLSIRSDSPEPEDEANSEDDDHDTNIPDYVDGSPSIKEESSSSESEEDEKPEPVAIKNYTRPRLSVASCGTRFACPYESYDCSSTFATANFDLDCHMMHKHTVFTRYAKNR